MPENEQKRPQGERPDEQFIEKTARHLEELWSKSHAKWADTDTFLDGTFVVWPDHPGRPAVRPAKARAIVDHAVDTQIVSDPQFRREPRNESETQNEAASAVENWMGAVWEQASLLEVPAPGKELARNLVAYGYGVLEGPYVRRSEKPARERGESEEDYAVRLVDWFPFRMRAPVITSVLLPWSDKRPGYAIKRVSQEGHKLAELTYDKRRRSKRALVDIYDYGLEPWKLIDTIEFFSDLWHALMVGSSRGGAGRLLYIEKNTDRFTPFTHGFSGWGGMPTDQSVSDPSYLAQGILDPVKDSLVRDAQRKSALHTAMMNMAYAPMRTTKDPAEAAQELKGDILQGAEGDWGWLKFPDMTRSSFQEGEEIERDIEQGTFTLLQAGFKQEDVDTVGQQAALMRKSNMKFQALSRTMEDMASVTASNFLRQADKLEVIPEVSGKKLKHDEIGGRYHIKATYELIDPLLSLQAAAQSERDFKNGLQSREGHWRVKRVEDTTTLIREMSEDRVYQMPAVLAELDKATMIRLGMAKLVKDREAAEAAQAAPAVPAPGPLEEPQRPALPGGPFTIAETP